MAAPRCISMFLKERVSSAASEKMSTCDIIRNYQPILN